MGAFNRLAIVTLVERSTRYTLLGDLPDGHGAEQVYACLMELMPTLPANLARSLTWDQGREMAEWAAIKIDAGIDVYFCDPHSPWQRPTNENTYGLLRQYFPRAPTSTGSRRPTSTPSQPSSTDAPESCFKDRHPPRSTLPSLRRPLDAAHLHTHSILSPHADGRS